MGFDWIFDDDYSGFPVSDEFEDSDADDCYDDADVSKNSQNEEMRKSRHHHRHGKKKHSDRKDASSDSSDEDEVVQAQGDAATCSGKEATLRIAELSAKVKELEEKCKSLEEEKTEAFNKMLLVKADSENYRKRLDKDKEETVRLANKGIVVDLLPGLDSIDVALSAIADDKIRQGIEMVKSALLSALGKWGLQVISPIDKEFDPMECEACLFEEREGADKEIVIDVLQAGYALHGKVIRPAKVKIAKPI